jgi:membrane-bound inhibitor of C-type lysozyme
MMRPSLVGGTLLTVLLIGANDGVGGVSAASTGLRLAVKVLTEETVTYQCARGEQVIATYFRLSDNSLRFVRIALPDGGQYTLPNIVSASGARYSDEREIVWWTKGRTAFVQARDSRGEWYTKIEDCNAVGNGG